MSVSIDRFVSSFRSISVIFFYDWPWCDTLLISISVVWKHVITLIIVMLFVGIHIIITLFRIIKK